MRRILIIITLLFSLNYGQNIPFKVGERLTYTLQFNVIKMGRGYLSVEANDTISSIPSYHVKFQAKTSKFADICVEADICIDCGHIDFVGDAKKTESLLKTPSHEAVCPAGLS